MPSSGLEDLDRAVQARRRARRLGQAADQSVPAKPPRDAGARPRTVSTRDPDSSDDPPRQTRRRLMPQVDPHTISRLGLPAALVPPGVLTVVATLLWLSAPDKGVAGAGQDFAAYFLALLAAPTILLTGLPFFGGGARVALAVATSAALWLAVGWWATRRTLRAPETTWRAYLLELAPMVLGVWAGVVVGLGAMVVILGR